MGLFSGGLILGELIIGMLRYAGFIVSFWPDTDRRHASSFVHSRTTNYSNFLFKTAIMRGIIVIIIFNNH